MYIKSFYLFNTLLVLILGFISLLTFLYLYKTPTKELLQEKNLFVKTTMLPDLAFCSDIAYIRHRSLSDVFSLYSNDGTLREYSLNSFTYNINIKSNSYE